MGEAENSGIENAAEESTSENRLEKSVDIEGRYTGSSDANYEARESGEKPTAKKSGKINGLGKAVSESKAKSNKGGNDDAEQLTKFHLVGYIVATYRTASEDDKDTINGAVAIIYHQNKETGNFEFLFEEKLVNYPIPEARGKLSFVGGAIQKGESSLEALVRELTEEIEEPAASIIIESLRGNHHPYYRLPYDYKGERGYIDIYLIEQKNDWNAVKWAAFKHDAGFPRILTHNDVIERSKDFAFGYGEIAREFVKNNLKPNESKFTPSLYAYSISKTSQFVFSEIKPYSLNL